MFSPSASLQGWQNTLAASRKGILLDKIRKPWQRYYGIFREVSMWRLLVILYFLRKYYNVKRKGRRGKRI